MWLLKAKNNNCTASGRNSSQYEPVHSTGLLSQSHKQGGESGEENVNSRTHPGSPRTLNLHTFNADHEQQQQQHANQLAGLPPSDSKVEKNELWGWKQELLLLHFSQFPHLTPQRDKTESVRAEGLRKNTHGRSRKDV